MIEFYLFTERRNNIFRIPESSVIIMFHYIYRYLAFCISDLDLNFRI